mgnify:CR=1 FL=1
MTATLIQWRLPVHFPTRLIQLRKAAGLTQQHLADSASVHVNQIRRYEAGSAQPTLEALVRIAKVLHVALDTLVFNDDDRGPDEELKLQFEAVKQLPPEDRQVIMAMLDGMIVKHRAKRLVSELRG